LALVSLPALLTPLRYIIKIKEKCQGRQERKENQSFEIKTLEKIAKLYGKKLEALIA
jgi:hypothetical protein